MRSKQGVVRWAVCALGVGLLAAALEARADTSGFTGAVNNLFTGSGFTSGVQVQNVGGGEATPNIAYYNTQGIQNSKTDGSNDSVLPYETTQINAFHGFGFGGSNGGGSYGPWIQFGYQASGSGNVWQTFLYANSPSTIDVGGHLITGGAGVDVNFAQETFVPPQGSVQVQGEVSVSPCGSMFQITNPTGLILNGNPVPGATVNMAEASKD